MPSPPPPERPYLAPLLGVISLACALVGLAWSSSGWSLPWMGGDIDQTIVWHIRAPRTVGAWVVGALLGLAGALAQSLFRNPLADPYLIGSASGAAFAVALLVAGVGLLPGTLGWMAHLGFNGAAFGGALAAVALTLLLSRGASSGLRLLLAGVVVGVVLAALTSLVTLLVPTSLSVMQGFMLGSTAFIGWSGALSMLAVLLFSLFLAWVLSPLLDGLTLGEATAHTLGLPLKTGRMALITLIALTTGVAVAESGLIAFVGLASPHLVRSLVKPTHARLLWLSSLIGGSLLLAADVIARNAWAPQEIPVGVLTAIGGGAYLLWLMRRT